MRAVVKSGPAPGCELLHDREEPHLAPDQVRIEVAAASVCGTDAALVASGGSGGDLELTFPRTLGHEVAGTVVEVGRDVPDSTLGARVCVESHLHCGTCWFCRTGQGHNCAALGLLGVTVDGGFAERLVVPARSCYPAPGGIDLEVGALMESAGSAVHAVIRSGMSLRGAAVLVTGAGPVGLVAAQVAAARGARDVLVVEPNPRRREAAARRGMRTADVSDDLLELGDRTARERGGFDLALECSGAVPALRSALAGVRREAVVVAVGLVRGEVPLDVADTLISRGITLRGSWGRSLWDTWDALSGMVDVGEVDLDSLITHRLPLDGLSDALTLMRNGAGKILLLPSLADRDAAASSPPRV